MGDTIVWWITLEVLGIAAFPVAAMLLRALPDRGYTASKIIGILLVGWLAYIIAMLRIAPFERWLLALCLLVVAAFSAWLLFRNNRAMLGEMRAHLRMPTTIRYIATVELLFAVAFVVWAIIRAYNPNILDQEKLMDFGFLNAILKSGTFPPNDMWLAGNPINYYYFGYVLMAAVTSLSGVPSQVAFNLANVALFSLTAIGTFGVVYNLIAATLLRRTTPGRTAHADGAANALPKKKVKVSAVASDTPAAIPVRRARNPQDAPAPRQSVATATLAQAAPETAVDIESNGHGRDEAVAHAAKPRAMEPYLPGGDNGEEMRRVPFYLSPYLYALLAVLMMVVMGNLTSMFTVKDFSQGADMQGNGFRFCFNCNQAQGYFWFGPSRVIQDYRTVDVPGQPPTKQKVGYETINEFPAFSFLLADLHPHVIALPLVLLAVAVALAFSRRKVLRGTRWRDGVPTGLRAWLSLILVGIILGSLYTTNTWDYPTYVLLALASLVLPYLALQRRSERSRGWQWLRPWVVQVVLIVVLSIVAFLPFHLTFKSFAGGQPAQIPDNLANIPIVGWLLQKLGSFILVNTADKTILGFLVIFGIFLVALLVWLSYELVGYLRKRVQGDESASRNNILYIWAAFFLITFLLAFILKFPLLALLLPISVVSLYLVWQEPRRTERNMALIMVALAAIIGLVVEVVFLKDNFQSRMNTLFKFYYQIWVLWALAAGYGLWRTLHAALAEREERVGRGQVFVYTQPAGVKAVAGIWAVVAVLLIISGMTFTYYGVVSRQIGGKTAPVGLDGAAWMQGVSPGDYNAINWLKQNGQGSDTVLEAGSAEYDYPGRVSSYTGVPTLIASDNSHESLWRTGQPELLNEIRQRRQVVNAIYQGNDPNGSGPLNAQSLLALLHQYNVDYVFVGDVERGLRENSANKRPDEQVTSYAEGLFKQALPVAYQSGTTTIYGVQEGVAGTGVVPATPIPGVTPGAPNQADPNVPPVGLFENTGSGPNRGQLNLPRGITRDGAGNFYVVDTENMRVQKFDPSGKFLLAFGSKGSSKGQFAPYSDTSVGAGPGGIAVDKSGNIYVADTWNHRIQKFDPSGKFLTTWGSFINLADPGAASDPDKDSKFFGPRGVAIGPDGNLYITDTGNKRVSIFDPTGKYIRQISSGMSPDRTGPNYPFDKPGELNEPIGIAVDGSGNVYVVDTNNKRIQKFDATGKSVALWPVPAGSWEPGPYLEPFLALDGAGNIYVTAPTGKSVLKYSPVGQLAGQKKEQGGVSLQTPTGITVSSDGTIYVVDTNAGKVINFGTIP